MNMSNKKKDYYYYYDRRFLAVAHEEKAWGYIEKEDYEIAISELTKAIENSNEPGDHYLPMEFYVERGECYFKEYDYDNAIADFNEALKLDPNYCRALSKRAETNAYFQLYDEAIDDYTRLIELNPDNAHYYFERGFNYSDAGLYNKAINDYEKVLELEPSNEAAAHNIKILTEVK